MGGYTFGCWLRNGSRPRGRQTSSGSCHGMPITCLPQPPVLSSLNHGWLLLQQRRSSHLAQRHGDGHARRPMALASSTMTRSLWRRPALAMGSIVARAAGSASKRSPAVSIHLQSRGNWQPLRRLRPCRMAAREWSLISGFTPRSEAASLTATVRCPRADVAMTTTTKSPARRLG